MSDAIFGRRTAAHGLALLFLGGSAVGLEIVICVRDHGRWVEPGTGNGERGRGLAVMRALMDVVEVTPSPEGTTVRMRAASRSASPSPE